MKHIFWTVPLLFVAGTAFAQPAGVSVALTATPANETQVPNNILLTATVHTPGIGVQVVGGAAPRYERSRMRFTFKAQRTWPCPAAATTLAENVSATGGSSGTASVVSVTHTASSHFVQPAAGEYTLSVDVSYLGMKKGAMTPTAILKPESLGSATTKYKVKPQPGFSGNVLTSFSPASPATAPASVNLTVYFNNSPESRWYRYTYWCTSGCQPGTATKDRQGASTTFPMQIPNPGSYRFDIGVDKVVQYQGQSTCTWEQTIVTHSNPYYYSVNAPATP